MAAIIPQNARLRRIVKGVDWCRFTHKNKGTSKEDTPAICYAGQWVVLSVSCARHRTRWLTAVWLSGTIGA